MNSFRIHSAVSWIGFLSTALFFVSGVQADTVTIQYFFGNVDNTPAGSVGVLVADVNNDGFGSVYKAGISGLELRVGENFAGSDDIIIGVTTATASGFQGGQVGFADTFAPIDYNALGVSEGVPVKFFWFSATNSNSAVVDAEMGFNSYDNGSPDTAGDIAYTLPAAPGVYTLSHLSGANGGTADVTPDSGTVGPILTHPVGGSFDSGTDVTLTVATQGNAALSFQWFEGQTGDNSNPLGGDSPNLLIPTALYGSSFWVRVSDATGSVDSYAANVGEGLRPEFAWSQVDGAEWYKLYITKDGALWKTLWVEGGTAWAPESNLSAGNYAWYVKDWNAATGDGQWTDAVTFSIGVPQLLTPEGVQVEGQWRPQFTWTRSPGATHYNLSISVNGALWQSIWLEGFTSDSWQSDVDMPPGSYTFNVRPWNPEEGGGPWSEPMSFSIGLPEPLAPEGLQNSGVTMPEFSWNGSNQLDYYIIYLQRNGTLWSETTIQAPATTWTPPEGLGSGNYKWWLRGGSVANGLTPWSESKEFEIQGLALLSPLGVVSGNPRPQFQWEAEPGATLYQLYVTGEAGGVFFDDWLEGVTSWTPITDMPEASYHWYIRPWSSNTGAGAWIGPLQFQIQGAAPSGFMENLTIPSGPATAPGDFNEDGMGDLVMQNSETGEVRLQFLSGDSLVGESNLSIQPGTAEWVVVGHGDIDNDQDNDLLWQNTQSGEILVWFLENGSTVSGSLALDYQFESPQWRAISLTDFDGDGHVDLLVQNSETGVSQVLFLVDFKFQSALVLSASRAAEWGVVAAIDFDGDGIADLLWQNKNTGVVEISYMSAATRYEITDGVALNGANLSSKTIVGVQDVDGDGQLDLISQELGSGLLSVLYLDGSNIVSISAMAYQPASAVWNVRNNRPIPVE